jgi:hypothetical protein
MQEKGALIGEVVIVALLKHAGVALAGWQGIKEARGDEELALRQVAFPISLDRQSTIVLDNQIRAAGDDSVGFDETVITMKSEGLLARVPHPMRRKVQILAERLVRDARAFATAKQAAQGFALVGDVREEGLRWVGEVHGADAQAGGMRERPQKAAGCAASRDVGCD